MKEHILKIGLTVAVMIIIPIVIVLLSPVYIVRIIVYYLSILRPDLSHMINSRSSILGFDLPFINSSPRATILVTFLAKGSLNIDSMRKINNDKIIEVKRENGKLRNKEFKQYPYQWMGFLFWKWEENFDIAEHINYYEVPGNNQNSKVSQKQLREIESYLLTKPYKKEKSPWEMLIIRNVESDSDSEDMHSVYLFRCHHSIADGFSLMKVLFQALFSDGTKFEHFVSQTTPTVTHKGVRHIMQIFKMVLLTPYQFSERQITSYDFNEWRISPNKFENKYFSAVSEKISMNFLRDIKDVHKVGLTAVIYSALTAAVRKAMMKNCDPKKLPERIHCMIPIPMDGHPDELTNHLTTVALPLPIGEADPIKRLKLLQGSLDSAKQNMTPLVTFYFFTSIGALFPWMGRFFLKHPSATFGGTSFPGPKKKLHFSGHEIVDLHFYAGPIGSTPAIFTSITYCDSFRMTISLNCNVLSSQQDVEDIQHDMRKELNTLRNWSLRNG